MTRRAAEEPKEDEEQQQQKRRDDDDDDYNDNDDNNHHHHHHHHDIDHDADVKLPYHYTLQRLRMHTTLPPLLLHFCGMVLRPKNKYIV
jgi:hypothetical protein